MSRFFPAHCNDDMLSRTNTAIPPPPCKNFFPLEIKCDLQDIFFTNHPYPPQKSNGRPLKPCLPRINCIRQAEIERIWICSIYFGFLNCQDKA